MKRTQVIISDCHLSAGPIFEGQINPYEDFRYDDEMCEMLEYFSSGKYGEGAPVELVVAGDFFDFLNVPFEGEFEEAITERMALIKLDAILAGHPRVMAAFRAFASKPGKSITYLIGNHDADLFFPQVRERITRAWDPDGAFPSERVRLVVDTDRIALAPGVELRHGNQLEAGSYLNFQKPLLTDYLDEPVLNIPWSSFFVLKIINRLKAERDYVDKVRPVKLMIAVGLITDPIFTIRFCFLCAYYFLKTRFIWSPKRRARLSVTLGILKQETEFLQDLESEAREILNQRSDLKTIIFGHTHRPMNRKYPDGKQYINTGTWTQMVNVDWRGLSQQYRRTFAIVNTSEEGQVSCELRFWVGAHEPHQVFDR